MIGHQKASPSTEPVEREAPSGVDEPRSISTPATVARRAYVLGIYLLAVSVVLQFLMAGLGIFFDGQFLQLWHAVVGASVIGGLPLLLIVIGRVGRVPGRTLWLTAAVTGLVVVQSLLLAPYHLDASGPLRALSGLHVVNALLIVWVVLRLLTQASHLRPGSAGSLFD